MNRPSRRQVKAALRFMEDATADGKQTVTDNGSFSREKKTSPATHLNGAGDGENLSNVEGFVSQPETPGAHLWRTWGQHDD